MHHEWKRIFIKNNNVEEYAFSGTGAFMCPICFNIIYCEISYTCTLSSLIMQIKNENQRDRWCEIYPHVAYEIECPDCGIPFNAYDIIDPNIAPIISLLNKKGYTTQFCCEGHDTDQYIDITEPNTEFEADKSEAYVSFINDETIISKIKSSDIPKPWYFDQYRFNDGRCSISCEYYQKELLDYRLEKLRKWAESLPEINEEEEESI